MQAEGFVSRSGLTAATRWADVRTSAALDLMLQQGLAMIDDPPAGGERLFWFPCLQISDTGSTVSGYSVARAGALYEGSWGLATPLFAFTTPHSRLDFGLSCSVCSGQVKLKPPSIRAG